MQRVGCNGCERTCIISWSRRGRRSCLTHLRAISTFYFSCSFPCHSLLTLYEFNHPLPPRKAERAMSLWWRLQQWSFQSNPFYFRSASRLLSLRFKRRQRKEAIAETVHHVHVNCSVRCCLFYSMPYSIYQNFFVLFFKLRLVTRNTYIFGNR